MLFLSIIGAIQLFDLVWVITAGGPNHSSETMAISMFQFGFKRYQQDTGAALYRRSLYVFWRRIVGPTMFFDVASRQTCTRQVRLAGRSPNQGPRRNGRSVAFAAPAPDVSVRPVQADQQQGQGEHDDGGTLHLEVILPVLRSR